MSATQAVIFTHIKVSQEEAAQTSDHFGVRHLIDRVADVFRSYLLCRNVGLVYCYVDVGMQLTLSRLAKTVEGSEVSFSLEELGSEERTRNCLKMAVDEVVQNLLDDRSVDFGPAQATRFQFVGLPHLLSLFNALSRIDKQLIRDLAADENTFTYDSPKFVEAIIRLVRSPHPIHGRHPVLRFDADVKVNEASVGELLAAVLRAWNTGPVHQLFSGGYGRSDGVADPVNDYAVRTHWLVNRETKELSELGYHFLRDLGELGASQVPTSVPMSAAMSRYAREKRGGKTCNRDSQQIISGAGLFMSQNAIRALPPFINSRQMITWVDDHLKRRLHEAVGHLDAKSLEHLPAVRFEQDRHPSGIDEDEVERAKGYFPRVLFGCLLHALIVGPDGKSPGLLSEEAKEIIKNPERVLHEEKLGEAMFQVARQRAAEVLAIWKEADYGDTPLRGWAAAEEPRADEYARLTVADALSYLRLVTRWHIYVKVIDNLNSQGAYWLFKRVG
jgi:hypothetical protein